MPFEEPIDEFDEEQGDFLHEEKHRLIHRSHDEEVADELVGLPRAVTAEFLGSFFLVFIGLGLVYSSAVITKDVVRTARTGYISFGYGCAIAAILYCLSYPSIDKLKEPNMRHLNPAVSLAVFLADGDFANMVIYWLAQFCGGGVASFFLYWLTPFNKHEVLSVFPLLDNVTSTNQWIMSFFLTYLFVLMLLLSVFSHMQKQPSVAASVREESPQSHHEINCIIAGVTCFACAMAGGPITGGYMNPIIAICVLILSDTYHLFAFCAPFGGAVAAIITTHVWGKLQIRWKRNLY